jgi:hypothetical protein
MEVELTVDPSRPRSSSRFLKQFTLPSDEHPFVGRIYDLSIIGGHFDTYEELACHADCKYAFDVNEELSRLTRRVESLNLAGGLLWPDPVPDNFKEFPISRYEWLTVAADVFLMRYISVGDCALLLTNTIFEVGLEPRKCSLDNLKKREAPKDTIKLLEQIQTDQGALRNERNSRFHHGKERGFSEDDTTFRMASLFEHWGQGIVGKGQDGRPINVARSFSEGLVELQREFNRATRKLVRQLDRLYDLLGAEFEARFSPRFRVGPFGREGHPKDDDSQTIDVK